MVSFKKQIQNLLAEEETFPQELLPLIPRGFQEISHRVILNFALRPELVPYSELIAQKIHEILPSVKAVWVRVGQIEGKFRQPKGLNHVWGDESTEIIVTEHGIRYKFDFTRIMFAKGNVKERAVLPKKIKEGEIVVDMFSGIGYFSLGIAKTKKPKQVYSIEWNPESFHYLKENTRLNKIEIITPIHGDCKIEVPKLAEQGIRADHIIMGLLPEPVDAIESALTVAKDEGTIVVYEGVELEDSTRLFDEFSEIAQKSGFKCELLERRLVKSFKPHEYHVVEEILLSKK